MDKPDPCTSPASRIRLHELTSCRSITCAPPWCLRPRPVLLILNTGRATRPCTSGAGCHFDCDNHAPKERVHYVFWHQTKACAAGRPYCTTNICRFRQQNTAWKVHLYNYFHKKRTYRPTTSQNGVHGTRSQQPNWSHDLCLLLAQALPQTYSPYPVPLDGFCLQWHLLLGLWRDSVSYRRLRHQCDVLV